MGIPYYPFKSCKVGSFELGISLSKFMKLVDKDEIKISDMGGKYPLVNNDTLDSYISRHGGRLERYNEFIVSETELVQDKKILKFGNMILSSCIPKNRKSFLRASGKYSHLTILIDNSILIRDWNYSTATMNDFILNGLNGNQILDIYKIIYLKKDNEKMLQLLYSYGLTNKMLAKYYKDEFYDLRIYKNSIESIVIREKVGNMTFTLSSFLEFFKSYKLNLIQHKKIDFLNSTQKNDIIKKANKKFGY